MLPFFEYDIFLTSSDFHCCKSSYSNRNKFFIYSLMHMFSFICKMFKFKKENLKNL